MNRRDAVRLGLIAGATAAGVTLFRADPVAGAGSASADNVLARIRRFTEPLLVPQPLTPVRRSETVDFYQITQQRALKEFVPGLLTEVWGYNGLVPGPTILAERDRQIVVRQINALPPVHPTRGYVPATNGAAQIPLPHPQRFPVPRIPFGAQHR